jgi:hypothetical protein
MLVNFIFMFFSELSFLVNIKNKINKCIMTRLFNRKKNGDWNEPVVLFYFIYFFLKKGLDGHIPSSNMKGRKKLGKYLTIEFSRGERERERESMKKW